MRRSTVLLWSLLFLILPARVAGQPIADGRADVPILVKGNNEFAFDLYARIRQDKESQGKNLFSSPYSISTALAMTYSGARGETAAQMARTLHFRLEQKRLHVACAELTRALNGHGLPRDYQLSVANSLWGQRGMYFLDNFTMGIKTHYGTRIRPVDFAEETQREQARKTVNRWVEERTNDKIKDLLQKGDLDQFTRLILVNAIYFKAAWETPFELLATEKDAAFHASQDKTVKVSMMRQTASLNYFDGGSYQALELPYEGRELSMVVLLPKDKSGLAKLEESLTAAKVESCLAGLKSRKVAVGLPKFKLVSRFNLSENLKAMGMPLAFTPGAADLTGMYSEKVLYIQSVIHQAFVGVDEEGTEAAAATAVIVGILPGPPVVETPVSFRADHPFMFLIRDNRTGSILFMGRVIDPTTTPK